MKTLIIILFLSTQIWALSLTTYIKGGLNFAKMKGDYFIEQYEDEFTTIKMNPGAFFALASSLNFSSYFAFQPEIAYSRKGFTEYSDYDTNTVIYEMRNTFIEIPYLLKFNIPTNKITPSFFVGPTTSFLINASMKQSINGIDTVYKEYESWEDPDIKTVKDHYKTFDFGITFGMSIDIKINRVRFISEARYCKGLTEQSTINFPDANATYNTFTVLAGIGFDITRQSRANNESSSRIE